MKLLTIKDTIVHTDIVRLNYFPEYELSVLKLMTSGICEPRLLCPVLLFEDVRDDALLIKPAENDNYNFWWRAMFPRELKYDEAVVIKADHLFTAMTKQEATKLGIEFDSEL
jgi:hypothetical protein